MEGAKEDGVEGFMKGLGKGLIGLVARPTTGIIDFASGSLNTIGRTVKGDTVTSWLRNPRFIPSDGIVRPYNFHQAEGKNHSLQALIFHLIFITKPFENRVQ